MMLFQYIGGIQWAYYEASGKFTSIADCAYANLGLDLVYVTTSPMYVLVFETLSGKLKYSYKNSNTND